MLDFLKDNGNDKMVSEYDNEIKVFMVCDAIAFFAAVNVILIWSIIGPLRLTNLRRMRSMTVLSTVVLGIALICMARAFSAIYTIILSTRDSLNATNGPSWFLTAGSISTFTIGPGICVFVFVTDVHSKRKKCLAILVFIIALIGYIFGLGVAVYIFNWK
eukprot:Gb_19489 [translate_table: standard]